MAESDWDPTQPLTTTKLRLVPSVITPNWDAIEDGDVPHVKVRLAEQAGNPTQEANRAFLYAKEDPTNGYTETFAINSNGNVVQLTRGVPTISASGYVYLPGGVLMQWGTNSAVWNGTPTITFPLAFSAAPYSITANTETGGASLRAYVTVGTFTATTWKPTLYAEGGSLITLARVLYWVAIGPA